MRYVREDRSRGQCGGEMFADVVASHAQIAKRVLDAQQLSRSLQVVSLIGYQEKNPPDMVKKTFRRTNKVLDLTAYALAHYAKIVVWK